MATDATSPATGPAAARPVAHDANVFWIFRDELIAINRRRASLNRPPLPIDPKFESADQIIDAIGLSLSGGGVRSAAVCLGVLQALNHHNALRNIDYLSTVSGGGYVGCSLTATMTKSRGAFVFGNRPQVQTNRPAAAEISDTDAVGHIRNYSNYLIPAGVRDLITGVAIVVRGLVANLGLVLPFVLLLAAVMIWSNPDRTSLLVPDLFGTSLARYLPVNHFGVTLALALAGLVLFFLWAIYRSLLGPDKQSEFRTRLPFLGATFLVLLAVAFFCDLQPFVVAGMFDIADIQANRESGVLLALVTGWIKTLAAIAAPIAAAVALFRQQFGDLLKAVTATSNWAMQMAAFAAKAAVWIAGAALPLLIWVGYLYLCYWGIINDWAKPTEQQACPPNAITLNVKVDNQEINYRGNVERLTAEGQPECRKSPAASPAQGHPGSHTPAWLLTSANWVSKVTLGRVIERPVAQFYLCTGILLFLLGWLLTPNANSLHRLYRDRLSKAFLFNPMVSAGERPSANQSSIDQGRDFADLDTMKLSELADEYAPYQLINAALNIQGSDFANRRGRNADFFLISKYWIGSEATGYAEMKTFEPAVPSLDLATAMAISGAAASSNMGANSIRPLTPTLAILNIRLGYWLSNPAFWAPSGPIPVGTTSKPGRFTPKHRSPFFLWSEISGRLYENASEVYLTDGGHIENLAIYELLRRRCRIIVAVDAEADPAMRFPSLITLQRYARIDLGVRIDLPWEPIQTATLALMGSSGGTPQQPAPPHGPHVAIGTIDYGGGQIGYLVYVKSSLTGDENDYVRDYARRYRRFPHESTGDQFFSEEQFEVYRSLGFHMMHGVLSDNDFIRVVGAAGNGLVKFNNAADPVVSAVRAALKP